jgi:hypothetical protein
MAEPAPDLALQASAPANTTNAMAPTRTENFDITFPLKLAIFFSLELRVSRKFRMFFFSPETGSSPWAGHEFHKLLKDSRIGHDREGREFYSCR